MSSILESTVPAKEILSATLGDASLRLPELLAPAGDWECVRAAVENGADAIYFGLDRFNARMRAKNFTEADLPALMEFLHRRGVRGYVTFNTLVFTEELPAARDYLRSLIAAGVDASIADGVGGAKMIGLLPTTTIFLATAPTDLRKAYDGLAVLVRQSLGQDPLRGSLYVF